MNKKKGSFLIPITIALSIGGMFIIGLSTFFGTQLATANRFGEVEAKVEVLGNEDKNINKRFDSFEENINKRFDYFELLLKQNGR